MKKFLWGLLVFNLLVINMIVVYGLLRDFGYVGGAKVVGNNNDKSAYTEPATFVDECGEECKRYIDTKISELSLAASTSGTITPTTVPSQSSASVQKTRSTSYVPIPGNGSTLNNDWTNIAGTDFYLNVIDYPGLTGVYLEVNMKLMNANGKAYVRLYDVTNGRGVDGSEVSTSSQTSVAVGSGKINLWAGTNLYRIQAKSLTADTTIYESGRLKIITEN